MAAPRNLAQKDEEKAEMNNPAAKKMKSERYPFSRWGLAVALGSFLVYSAALFCIYRTMPAADFKNLKLPRSLADLRMLKDHLGSYAKDHPAQFILGYCSTYIFMQTFMIPGTVFLSLLAGALFGVVRGLILVVFNATAGATACFFLSNLIGRPLVSWMWLIVMLYLHPTSMEAAKSSNVATRPGCLEQPVERPVVGKLEKPGQE